MSCLLQTSPGIVEILEIAEVDSCCIPDPHLLSCSGNIRLGEGKSMVSSLLFYGSCTHKPMGLSLQGWAPGGGRSYWAPTKHPGCLSSPPHPSWTFRTSSTLCWGRSSPRGPIAPTLPLCGQQKNDPQDVLIAIPATCEYGTLYNKRDFASVTKDPGMGGYPGWSRWAQCHHQRGLSKRSGGPRRCDNRSRGWKDAT